jgi:hypothetical protein
MAAMPAAPQAAIAASTAPRGGGLSKPLIYGGLAVLAIGGVAAALMSQSQSPLAPGAGGTVAVSSNQALSLAVQAIVDRARAAQIEARTAAVAARTNADLGRQAAWSAEAGQLGFGVVAFGGGVAKGDIAGLQASRPAPVVIAPGDGSEFAGLMQAFSQTQFRMNGVNLEPGGVSFQGRAEAQNGPIAGVGISQMPGRYTFEGTQRGSTTATEITGETVVSYANGERYEGEFRLVGSGAAATLFRHGLGVHYAASGAVINAGRFDNDRYVGAQ